MDLERLKPDSRSMVPHGDQARQETLTMPEFRLDVASKRMIDLSTAHITNRDIRLFGVIGSMRPRAVAHEYGLIVFVCSDEEHVAECVDNMRQVGASDAFINIYKMATRTGGDCMLINFDQDGDLIEGLPTFD
jgi:hypothetical protein